MTPPNHKPNHEAPSEYSLVEEEDLDVDLDPALQDIFITERGASSPDPPPGGGGDEMFGGGGGGGDVEVPPVMVDVIAKLADPSKPVEGLNIAQYIGQIVTGTVRADKIKEVRENKNVLSLKAAQRVHKALDRSVKDIRATSEQLQNALPASLGKIDGSDVVIGIIDHGCDFAHPNFISKGKTRIKYLWVQQGGETTLSPDDFPYGREFGEQEINYALAASTRAEAYQRLRYTPSLGAHGTYVMDIAAGSGSASNPPGVAPGADIIFVDLWADDFGPQESYGDSRHLLEAIKYVFKRAGTKQAVVNLSVNVNGGPHDGSSLFEQGIDTLLRERDGRAVVIASGNSRMEKQHVARQLPPGHPTRLLWVIPQNDTTTNKLDLWYKGTEELEIFLYTPNNKRLGPFPLGKTITINRQNQPAGRVYHRKNDPNNGDHQVVIQFGPLMEAGTWRIALRPLGTHPVVIHAWIEREVGKNSTFDDVRPTDTACTIGSLACGNLAIAVSAYDPDAAATLPALTAEGPTRNDRSKPEVSAPGFMIRAAMSQTDYTQLGEGSSAAAPHVAGLIALMMQAAGKQLSVDEIRDAVMHSARLDPPPGGGWDACFGIGRVDAVAAILYQLNNSPLILNLAGQSAIGLGSSPPLDAAEANPLTGMEDPNALEGESPGHLPD